jgi:hypothetical protein
LVGVDKLPEEFFVSKTTGLPKPPAPKKESRGGGNVKKEEAKLERVNSMTSEQKREIEETKARDALITRTSGRLEPCKSETIEISFNALRE